MTPNPMWSIAREATVMVARDRKLPRLHEAGKCPAWALPGGTWCVTSLADWDALSGDSAGGLWSTR
jgi:hypothetical protein